MGGWWRIARVFVGTALFIIGLASLPDDLQKWRQWLAMIPISPDWYAPALIVVGLLVLLTAFFPWFPSDPSVLRPSQQPSTIRPIGPSEGDPRAKQPAPDHPLPTPATPAKDLGVQDQRAEDLRVVFRSVAADAFNQAHELLNLVATRLEGADRAKQAVSVLIRRFVMEADRAAWTRLGTAIDGDDPAAEADRQPEALQHVFGDFFEKYQWMTTWIHRGLELISSDSRLEDEYRKWRQTDKQFMDRFKLLVARTEFEPLRQDVRRVGWADNFRQ